MDFDRGEFERTLKEYADQFFLIPSEKVWKSIYNDIHPGSKWPSLAAGLFMVLTLFWVGRVNNRQFPVVNPTKVSSLLSETDNKDLMKLETTVISGTPQILSKENAEKDNSISISNQKMPRYLLRSEIEGTATREIAPPVSAGIKQDNNQDNNISAPPAAGIAEDEVDIDLHKYTKAGKNLSYKINDEPVPGIAEAPFKLQMKVPAIQTGRSSKRIGKSGTKDLSAKITINSNKRNRLELEYFIAPTLSNVVFSGNNLNKSSASVTNSLLSTHNVNKTVKIGVILGTNLYYKLTNRLSVVSGLHLVHTGYDIYSDAEYPKMKSLTFMDKSGRIFSKNYISYYGNDRKRSDMNITNFNWQLAVPVGAEMDIASVGPLDLGVISTFEPFVILGGRAYLLTGDASGFVTDPNLVRKFNANVNFGTMVKFSGKYMNWRIGPTIRYQLISTYNHIYPVKEHFINYGLHVGVSKK